MPRKPSDMDQKVVLYNSIVEYFSTQAQQLAFNIFDSDNPEQKAEIEEFIHTINLETMYGDFVESRKSPVPFGFAYNDFEDV
ncbi:hypothetical protein PCE1_004285 [Barthelona sp. PCE]